MRRFRLRSVAVAATVESMRRWAGAGVLAVTLIACGDDGTSEGGETGSSTSSGTPTSGAPTSGPDPSTSTGSSAESSSSGEVDEGTSSTGTRDESSSSGAVDGSSSSSGGTDDGLGELMGRCGVLGDMQLTGDMPGFFVNTLDFEDVGFDYDQLTPGGQQIFDDGNLGGSSLYSEVVAYEVLARCEGAELVKTEAEIVYDEKGPRTDLLVDFDGTSIGVSVVRAQGFPLDDPYTVEQATTILEDKLGDIPLSTAAVSAEDAWTKQILHVVAYAPMHAESLQTAYEALGPELTLDTIVVVTVTEGDDLFIYTE